MPAVGLARESSDAAEKELAYSFQVARLKEYGCQWIFGDRVSGTKDDRKGLEQALEKIKAGEADELVVTHFTRLARSVLTAHRVMDLLKKHDAKLTVLDSPVDTSSPEGRFAFQLRAGLAALEAELGAERQKIGWQNSRNLARPRSPVFGYLIEDGRFAPDEENWGVARSIVEKYFELHSLNATLVWIIKEHGHLKSNSRQRRPPFTGRGLRQWLLNPVLAGRVEFLGGTVRYLNQHAPLLTDAEQAEVRGIIAGKISGIERTGERRYAYSGLVFCGVCGSRCAKITIPLSRSPKQSEVSNEPNYLYYRCGQARYKNCTNRHRVRATVIDIAVLIAIEDQAELIARFIAHKLAPTSPRQDPRILDLQQQIERLELVAELDPSINDVIARKNQEIQNLLNDSNIKPSTDQLREGLEIMIGLQEPGLWPKYTPKEKSDRLRLLIKRVVIIGYAVQRVEFLPWLTVPEL